MGQRGTTTPAGQVPTFKSPGSSAVSSVTDDSKCDYVVYTLKGDKQGGIVVVLMEAKTTSHTSFTDAVAQVTSNTLPVLLPYLV